MGYSVCMNNSATTGLGLPVANYKSRLEKLRASLGLAHLSGLLVTHPANIRYLSGFTGSSGMLLVQPNSTVLLTDERYGERAKVENVTASDVVVGSQEEQLKALRPIMESDYPVALEARHMTLAFHRKLVEHIPGVEFTPAERLVEQLRLIKDAAEIARLTAAAGIADRAFCEVQPFLSPGVTEQELAEALEAKMRELGSDSRSFATIVASGPNTAFPHATPRKRKIQRGELVVVDFGATVDGYHSDTTRTVWIGELEREQKDLYKCVLYSNSVGISAMQLGVTHAHVDRCCRDVVEEGGYAAGLRHPSGHNIGLEVHELPYLTSSAQDELQIGQVLTVEPGVYLREIGGVRVEDLVLISDEGPIVLSQAPKLAPGAVG